MSTYGCQQIRLHPNREIKAILEYLCSESNKIYNCAVYYGRQIFFKTGRIVNRAEICAEMSRNKNRHFTAIYVSSSQQTCNAVAEALKGFKQLLKVYKQGKIENKPSLPKYRKHGLFTVSFPKKWLKLTEPGVRIPLGTKVKAWFGIDSIYLPFPSNLNWTQIKEIHILPKNRTFYVEFVYTVEQQKAELDSSKVLGIDHGINNWLTCVSNTGSSFIVDGKHLKSLNQWYNKQVAKFKQGQPQGFWSNRLAALTEKRNR